MGELAGVGDDYWADHRQFCGLRDPDHRQLSAGKFFKWRQFEPEVILLAVGRSVRFSLS